MKILKIRFKAPDQRAGQVVDLDEAGARRAIEAGEAEAVPEEPLHKSAKAPSGDPERRSAPAKKTARRSK